MSKDHLPSSSKVFQEHFLGNFISRKLLMHNPFDHNSQRQPLQVAQAPPLPDKNNLGSNVLMLLSILVCGMICSLGLHYIIRCAFRRSSSFMISDPISSPSEMNLSGLGEECVICLSDFADGEQLRLLPKCNHGFHVNCIDKWLTENQTCPKCRHCLVETCQKILGDCNEADQRAETPAVAPTESIEIRIAPLEPLKSERAGKNRLRQFIHTQFKANQECRQKNAQVSHVIPSNMACLEKRAGAGHSGFWSDLYS